MPWNWSAQDIEPGRKKRALGADLTPMYVSGESATFAGSSGSVYTAGLDSCTCKDFGITRQPCKHILRLGMILGYISGEGMVSDQSAAAEKLALGELERNIKTGHILLSIALIRALRLVFSGHQLRLSDHPYLEGNPLISVDRRGMMCPVNRHKKTLHALTVQFASRVGDLAAEHLDDAQLVGALVNLENEALALDEFSLLLQAYPQLKGSL